jgi:hypothetical protein
MSLDLLPAEEPSQLKAMENEAVGRYLIQNQGPASAEIDTAELL